MTPQTPVTEEELRIDTSRMSEGKRAALQVTEAAREARWEHPSFALELFQGRFRHDLILPFPLQEAGDAKLGDEFIEVLGKILRDKVDPDEIDRTGEIPDAAIEALARRVAELG